MPNVTNPTHRRRLTAGLIVLGATAFGVSGLDAATAASTSVTCKSSDLVYKRTDGSAQFTARVASLRSRYFSCAAARDVSGYVTKQALFGREITRYRNFKITGVQSGPDTQVRATRPVGDGRISVVTFTIQGGR
jgi:hypothetical protein